MECQLAIGLKSSSDVFHGITMSSEVVTDCPNILLKSSILDLRKLIIISKRHLESVGEACVGLRELLALHEYQSNLIVKVY